jgi:hypothetical protein
MALCQHVSQGNISKRRSDFVRPDILINVGQKDYLIAIPSPVVDLGT